MKSNNQYLKSINESVGGQVADTRRPNNWYLKNIAKSTGSDDIHGHWNDNHYLKLIASNLKDGDIAKLLETIAELRAEIEQLELLFANDIHLFTNDDTVSSGEILDVFSYCKHDMEEEGNTVYFYVIEQ